MLLVEMTEVGRNNASAIATMESLTFDRLLSMARPHLVSSNISFDIESDGTGRVLAGFRTVGKIKVTELKK